MLTNAFNCLGNFLPIFVKSYTYIIRQNASKLANECIIIGYYPIANQNPGQIYSGIKMKTEFVKIMRVKSFYAILCRKSVSKTVSKDISHQNRQQSRARKMTGKTIHTVLVQAVGVLVLLVQAVGVLVLLVQVVLIPLGLSW